MGDENSSGQAIGIPISAAVNDIIARLGVFSCHLELNGARRVRIASDYRGAFGVPVLPPSIPAAVEMLNDDLARYMQQLITLGAEPMGRC